MNTVPPPQDARALSEPPSEFRVIIANLHYRYTGVTATSLAVTPRIARLIGAAWLGSNPPEGVRWLTAGDLIRLRFGAQRRQRRVWHARRNVEMIAGWLLARLGWPFRLVFTSAAQRHHKWLTRFLISRMDAVIAVSEESASYLKRAATVILHGVDTERYRPPADRAALAAQLGLPGRRLIGCFGRVRHQKGTDLFVEAMCQLLPRYPEFTAVIVGAITPEQQVFANGLRQRIDAAGLGDRIRMLGELPIEDVPRWQQALTIFAFTSRNEGFGLTLLEAMACGVAVVAARAGAAERVISPEAGVLVPTGDAAALTAALEPLMRDPDRADAMGRSGRALVRERFSVDAEAQAIAAVYRRVLEAE